MTREDREHAIVDNIAYVTATLSRIASEFQTRPPCVFAGVSQGVAMAFRAATHTSSPSAIIAVAGTVSAVLLCRDTRDVFHQADQFEKDVQRLLDNGVRAHRLDFDGAHEWSPEVSAAAGFFLLECST